MCASKEASTQEGRKFEAGWEKGKYHHFINGYPEPTRVPPPADQSQTRSIHIPSNRKLGLFSGKVLANHRIRL